MSVIGTAIKQLRREQGLTQEQLAELVGLPRNGISKREAGLTMVRLHERALFAKAFGISLEEFDTFWRSKQTLPQTKGANGIPIINRAPAGNIVDYEEYGVDSGQGYEYIDFGQLPQHEHLFAVIVTGDSMDPTLKSDEIAIFRPLDRERPSQFQEGSICFVRFSAEHDNPGCTIARVWPQEDGDIQLTKDNPSFKPMAIKREHIEQIAVAVERRMRLN